MRRLSYLSYVILAMAFANCSSSTEDQPVKASCTSQPQYFFNEFGSWLHAGQTFLSIADPSNPTPYTTYSYRGWDTLFTISSHEYVRVYKDLYFDSIPRSLYEPTKTLEVAPTHIAATSNILYLLRHVQDANSNLCRSSFDTVSALEVRDASKVTASLLDRVSLPDPQDVAVTGSTLYVLDASRGLTIFNVTDPTHPSLLGTYASIIGYHMDLTPQQTLIVHSVAGLTQYDVSNPTSPALLGKIQ
jgi:hypothetical protein